jgi:cytidine deaminase
MPVKKVCLVAPSGAGKSTAASHLVESFRKRGLSARIYKLAEPLYDLQSQVYARARRPIERHRQDHRLLELIADEMRRINPTSILEDFMERVAAAPEQVVVNDDLRDLDTDYAALREAGFVFIKITASARVRARRMNRRDDLLSHFESKLDRDLRAMDPDFLVVNETDHLGAYQAALDHVVERL